MYTDYILRAWIYSPITPSCTLFYNVSRHENLLCVSSVLTLCVDIYFNNEN